MVEAIADAELSLDGTWRAWIAENLASGVSSSEIVEVLVRRGISVTRADHYVAEEVAGRPRRTGPDAQLLRTLAAVHNQNGSAAIARLDATDPQLEEKFFADFYGMNRPVVVTGFASGAPVSSWSLSYLAESFGEQSVLVQANRADQSDAFRRGLQRRVLLRDYLRSLSAGCGNSTYLTGNDKALSEPGLRQLSADLSFDSNILLEHLTPSCANLWIGGAGATSPLHCDRMNVLNLQVVGRKAFRLAHPGSMPDVYSIRGKFSVVDALDPDLERFPEFGRVRLSEVVLEPLDALLIPVGWWHHVEALEPSINVSFTNFSALNQYDEI